MHQIQEIQKSFQPFTFIADIEDIIKDFGQIENGEQAIILRTKLNKLAKKPYYPQLNQHQIHQAIQNGLLYLATHYPINDEDPISLDSLSESNSVAISTGHRFEINAFLPYFKQQSWFSLKNPFTNTPMARTDVLRIIEAIEKKHPEEFKTSLACQNKELLLWSQKVTQSLANFLAKDDETQIKNLEVMLIIQLSTQPIIDTTILHFMIMNYFVLIKKVNIPEIQSFEAKILLFSNLLSLVLNHFLLDQIVTIDFNLPSNFRFCFFSNLSRASHLIVMDIFFSMINYLTTDIIKPNDNLNLQSLQAMLLCYGFYMVCLQIKYRKRHFNIHAALEASLGLLGLYCFSHLFKSIGFSGFYMLENGSDAYQLANADNLYYFPLTIFFYMYLSELINLSARLRGIIQNDADHLAHEQALEEVLAQPFQM